jgi:hypothetical protein
MRDGMLTWADGEVRLGSELLPGVFLDLSIRGAVRFDQSHKDSQSGKAKVPLGFEDADITITMELLCDETGDCYSKLKAINKVFRSDNKANPKVYAVVNRHCAARGIQKVLFSGLDSFESEREDVITATLSFLEHMPAVIRREKRATAAKVGQAPAVKAKPAASAAVVSDPDNPFMAGLKAGHK